MCVCVSVEVGGGEGVGGWWDVCMWWNMGKCLGVGCVCVWVMVDLQKEWRVGV